MQPQSPSPAPPPITPSGQQPGQYDFLFHEPQKKGRLPLNPGNLKQRILIIVGGGVLLLVVGLLLFSVLGGGGSNNELLAIAQKQAELIRVANIGNQKARSATAKNLAVTTSLSLTSEQSALLKVMNPKPDTKELALGRNKKTDTLLATAEQNNQFDQTFVTEIQNELSAYQKAMKQAYDNASNSKVKAVLAAEYHNASILANAKE